MEGKKRPASSRCLELMFLSDYQSKKTGKYRDTNYLGRKRRTRALIRSYYLLDPTWCNLKFNSGTSIGP
jgi:hypothetical protein